MSTDGLRGGTFGGGASAILVSCIVSELPIDFTLVSKLLPFDRLSSLSEMSAKKNNVPDRFVGVETTSNESVLVDDSDVFRLFVPDFDDFIPGDFN